MARLFVVEDDFHAEPIAEFSDWGGAVAEVRRLASLTWSDPPNRAPCHGWTACGRDYHIVEYDVASSPWTVLGRTPALKISAEGVEWSGEFEASAI